MMAPLGLSHYAQRNPIHRNNTTSERGEMKLHSNQNPLHVKNMTRKFHNKTKEPHESNFYKLKEAIRHKIHGASCPLPVHHFGDPPTGCCLSALHSRPSQGQVLLGSHPMGTSPSLKGDAVEEDDAVDDDSSGASLPHSAIILFLQAWQIDSKESGDTSSM